MTITRVHRPAATARPFEHVALLYENSRQYVSVTTRFVLGARESGNPALVAAPPGKLDMIRAGLGPAAGGVEFIDMCAVGRNPGKIMPALLVDFLARHPGRRPHIVGEPVWPGRSAVEYPACAIHEALINVIFAGRDAAILCPYDAAGLRADAIDDACRTHPTLTGDGTRRPSGGYQDPLDTAARYNNPLPAIPAGAAALRYGDRGALADVRRFVADHAARAGLDPSRVADLVVAVNELATNTLEHTDGAGRVRVWTEGGAVVCQVDDQGQVDPLAGRVLPPVGMPGGRGLVLVNQLSDLVRVHSVPGQTSTRLYVDL